MSNRPEWVPLSSVLQTIIDNRGKSVPTVESGFPLIATNCIKETSIYPTFENVRYVSCETLNSWFRAHLEPNDILFVNKGTPGRVCLVPDPVPFCAAQDMIGLRADPEKIDFRYLFAFLRSSWVKQTIANNHVGLVIPHFRKRDLDTLSVPIRARKEQEKIGELYLLLSKKIELNNQINAELETVAKLLYDYWFVQFDFPMTKAQAASLGRPELEGKPYRTSGGKMVHNPTLNREIPEGWSVVELKDIAQITMGQSPPGESYNDCGRGEFFFQGSTDFGWRFPAPREYTTAATRIAQEGDVLLSVRAPVGALNVAPLRCAIGRGLAALRSKDGHDAFLFFVMQYFKTIFDRRNGDGTTFGSIGRDDLRSLKLALPPAQLVERYEENAAKYNQLIFVHHQQNQELAQLRDWLLPMLMNGQVTVG